MRVALAQISSVLLDPKKTIQKIIAYIDQAAADSADLVIFGEALLPGYPFWLSPMHASKFNDAIQKDIHARYIQASISPEAGDIDAILSICKQHKIACYLGTIERAQNRGGHSLYCSLIYIDKQGVIQSVHRKLQPTYEERLSWSPGDGHGLKTHKLCDFTVGGLNCWENWMPLSRAALYGLGENCHIAVWPGVPRNTVDLTPVLAKEGRSYSISVSGMLRRSDIPQDFPHYDLFYELCPELVADGGSCIAAPDGSWVIEPQVGEEGLFTAELDIKKVWEERQNFDPVGHYSRPDVTRLIVDRSRQSIIEFKN